MYSSQPNNFWTINTFGNFSVPEFAAKAYAEVLPYVKDFLTSPHPRRKGIMCPFVPTALKNDRIFFTFFEDDSQDHNLEKNCKEFIGQCVNFYLNTKSNKKQFGALLVLFPENYSIAKLLEIHLHCKEQCVHQSLMLGALWDTNPAQSLHHSEYFPLRTPTPILVIRDLTVNDLIFLEPKQYKIKTRLSFLKTFISTFSGAHSELEQRQVKEAIRLKLHYERKLHAIYCVGVLSLLCLLILIATIIFM
jgi:hypothetical protein